MSSLRRQRLGARDGIECAYCGGVKKIKKLTLDHLIPKSRGGTDGYDNLVLACKDCNSRKSSLTVWEFVKKRPDCQIPEAIIRRIGAEAAYGMMELTE